MIDFFLKDNNQFIPFSAQHFGVVLFLIFCGVALILWAKKQNKKTQTRTGNLFAFSIAFTIIFGTFLKMYKGDFNYQEDLPLHLCSFLGLTAPLLSLTKKFVYYEVFFFLVMAGTLQSVITPDEYNYLNFPFFRYWFVHAGLVIFMMYATFVYKMRPTLKSVWKSFSRHASIYATYVCTQLLFRIQLLLYQQKARCSNIIRSFWRLASIRFCGGVDCNSLFFTNILAFLFNPKKDLNFRSVHQFHRESRHANCHILAGFVKRI